jgi:hypothetical protein
MKQGGTHRHGGQNFERKHDLLDVVDVGEYQARRAVNTFGKESVHDHTHEQKERKTRFVFSAIAPQRALKTTENTNVCTESIKIGLKNDHTIPSTEPR